MLATLASVFGAPLAANASDSPSPAGASPGIARAAGASAAKSSTAKEKAVAKKKTAEKKAAAKRKAAAKKPAKKKHAAKKKPAKKKPAKKKPAPAALPQGVDYGTPLVGTFKIAPGGFSSAGGPTGSYLRMVLAGGTIGSGPYFDNLFSGASDKTYTLINPGTDGGLVTGSYQPAPSPAFGLLNSALADRIMAPQSFEAINFSVSTQPVDPQTGQAVPPPGINDLNGKLNGEVAAVTAEWANNYFNQGTPKPDGSTPGLTEPVTGTYDPSTGAYELEWASTIVGGPFDHFTGYWHLAGTFQPSN